MACSHSREEIQKKDSQFFHHYLPLAVGLKKKQNCLQHVYNVVEIGLLSYYMYTLFTLSFTSYDLSVRNMNTIYTCTLLCKCKN